MKQVEMIPKVSLVVCVYNMARELPRTLRSLSPIMQLGVAAEDYEVIVVDNGSTVPVDEDACRQWGAELRVIRIDPAAAQSSPVRAINAGIAQARGELIGVMIDGARIASPGIVKFAAMADKAVERAVVLILGFHIGVQVQMLSVQQGYNQEQEDRLLEEAHWTEDGYRLFDISVLAGSSQNGWFGPMNESNAIFMRRTLWTELGGYDERFQTPGGGLANLDLLGRAVTLPQTTMVTLLGEGTFHQVHGGIATNATHDVFKSFSAEYVNIRGHEFQSPVYQSLYLGTLRVNTLGSIGDSARRALARK